MPAPRQTRHPLPGDPHDTNHNNSQRQPTAHRRAPAPRPVRPGPRARAARGPAGGDVLAAQAHLTDRDRTIIDWVDRHGVLTTTQLTAAWFTSPTTAAHRLAKLRELGLLDRFHRPAPGAWFTPWHWVIGPLGAAITADPADGAGTARRPGQQREAAAPAWGQPVLHRPARPHPPPPTHDAGPLVVRDRDRRTLPRADPPRRARPVAPR
jgi:hypothetical protein